MHVISPMAQSVAVEAAVHLRHVNLFMLLPASCPHAQGKLDFPCRAVCNLDETPSFLVDLSEVLEQVIRTDVEQEHPPALELDRLAFG
jgi:hypothetical protein